MRVTADLAWCCLSHSPLPSPSLHTHLQHFCPFGVLYEPPATRVASLSLPVTTCSSSLCLNTAGPRKLSAEPQERNEQRLREGALPSATWSLPLLKGAEARPSAPQLLCPSSREAAHRPCAKGSSQPSWGSTTTSWPGE